MKQSEAYSILGLSETATEDEANKAFRNLSKKYHPDLNLDKSDEEKKQLEAQFKKINEAIQIIKDPSKAEDSNPFSGFQGGFGGNNPFDAIFGGMGNINFQEIFFNNVAKHVHDVKISFKECVLGCKKSVDVKKSNQCSSCHGARFNKQGVCQTCKGSGFTETNETQNVSFSIPAGIPSGATLNLMQNNQIRVIVEPQENMELNGQDIVSKLDLTLLEVLKGTTKKVNTINGEMTLNIRKNTKNLDQIHARNMGVAGKGSHIFLVNVHYPEDTSKVIEALESEVKEIHV